jgi:hypothetical protein
MTAEGNVWESCVLFQCTIGTFIYNIAYREAKIRTRENPDRKLDFDDIRCKYSKGFEFFIYKKEIGNN